MMSQRILVERCCVEPPGATRPSRGAGAAPVRRGMRGADLDEGQRDDGAGEVGDAAQVAVVADQHHRPEALHLRHCADT